MEMREGLLERLAERRREAMLDDRGRDADPIDDAWITVTLGQSGMDQAIAASRQRLTQEEIALRSVLFRPFDAEEKRRLVAALLPESPPVVPQSHVVRRIAFVAVAMAAATVLVLAYAWRVPSQEIAPAAVAMAEIPSFAFEVDGTSDRLRGGDDEGVLSFSPGGRITIVARPLHRTALPFSLAVYVSDGVSRGASAERLEVPVRRAEGGTLEVAGPVAEILPLSPGRWILTLAVGPEADLPLTWDPARVPASVRVETRTITLESP